MCSTEEKVTELLLMQSTVPQDQNIDNVLPNIVLCVQLNIHIFPVPILCILCYTVPPSNRKWHDIKEAFRVHKPLMLELCDECFEQGRSTGAGVGPGYH